MLATSLDICHPEVRADTDDPRLVRHGRERRRTADLVGGAAIREPVICAAAVEVNTLSVSAGTLQGALVLASARPNCRSAEPVRGTGPQCWFAVPVETGPWLTGRRVVPCRLRPGPQGR
jgi:hypothetical protein